MRFIKFTIFYLGILRGRFLKSPNKMSVQAGGSRRHSRRASDQPRKQSRRTSSTFQIPRRGSTPGFEITDPFCCKTPLINLENELKSRTGNQYGLALLHFIGEAHAGHLFLPSDLAGPGNPGDFRTPGATVITVSEIRQTENWSHAIVNPFILAVTLGFYIRYDENYCLGGRGNRETYGFQERIYCEKCDKKYELRASCVPMAAAGEQVEERTSMETDEETIEATQPSEVKFNTPKW